MDHSKFSNGEPDAAICECPIVQLTAFWSWLPAFRVVAETLHLPTASHRLGVGASTLSRAVRLLESNLGVELFRRVGSRLELTESGRTFLSSVRDGMRGIHDGMLAARGTTLRGTVRISSLGAITTIAVVPALLALRAEFPELCGTVLSEHPEDVPAELLDGRLDLAVQSVPVRTDALESIALGELTTGIYCGPGHSLFDRVAPVDVDELMRYEFVSPGVDEQGRSVDGWPDAIDRRIGLEVDQMRVGAEACASGGMLAVLTDALVARLGLRLQRVSIEIVPPLPMFAIVRRRTRPHSKVRVALEAIIAQMRAALASVPTTRARVLVCES
ncbi:MAG: LysR family transcriptional regulator [Planctomycetes bacterium]|nr:LysR family transcriptional regulator [Planctomycetota bacterium]